MGAGVGKIPGSIIASSRDSKAFAFYSTIGWAVYTLADGLCTVL
jgi:hypothetical protein